MTEITDSKLTPNTMMIVDAANTESRHVADNDPKTNMPVASNPSGSSVSASTDMLIGSTFDGKYRIEKRLGEGGMGVVYRATHVFIERSVAIKFLRSDYRTNNEIVERFKLEARAAGRIQHINVTSILDFGIKDSMLYLVMEYLQGQTLRQRLHNSSKVTPIEMLRIVLQICAALEVAHKCNIIHRDLKPENIFLQQKDGTEQVKVLDFGIAKILQSPTEELTAETILGTPYYMSPEQCQCDPLSPAADIYSLGIIIFELLTGRLPFVGTSPISIAFKHLNDKPPSLRQYCPDLPEAVETVVMRALAKRPEHRQHSAQQLAEELEQAMSAISEITLLNPDKDNTEELVTCLNSDCRTSYNGAETRCPACEALTANVLIRHRFKVNKMVGKGGFGTTYLVSDLDCFDEPRILKELCPTMPAQQEHVPDIKDTAERLFRREAMVLLNLQHQGIPKLYAYFNEDGYTYLIQDFIPGQTLSEELKRRSKCYTETEALGVLSELANVLDYLHSCKPPIIHRDIKPQNIMRHKDGPLMLIDFGAVCQAVAHPEANQTVIGSLGYAPPEQFLGQTMPQSDLYAAGATVVYLLTGIPPRLLLNSQQSLQEELSDKASPGLIQLLVDLLVTDVDKRLASAAELKRRLQLLQPQPASTVNTPKEFPALPKAAPVAAPVKAGTAKVEATRPAANGQHYPPNAAAPVDRVPPTAQPPRATAKPPAQPSMTPAKPVQPPMAKPAQPAEVKRDSGMPASLNIQDIANFCYEVEMTVRSIEYANHFAVLGVKREASEDEIRRAFLQLSNKFDPERHHEIISYNQSIRFDLEKIHRRISEAYNVLSNQRSRNEYNRNFRTGRYEVAGDKKL